MNRRAAILLPVLVLSALSLPAPPASAASGPRLPRFELRTAVATSPRALPSAADTSDLRERLTRDAMPRSLAAVDLDGDGMPELAAGFALSGGAGLVALWRGNPDALFPWSDEAREHRADRTFTDAPFLGPSSVLFVPEAADLLAAGDVDGDGRGDLLAVARGGSTVYRFRGDGAGGLGAAPPLQLPGTATAWAVERLGGSARVRGLAIAVDGTEGPRVLRFTGPGGVLTLPPETVALPAPASELLLGAFGDDGRPGLGVVTEGPFVLIRDGDDRPTLATRSTIDLDAARLDALHALRQGTPLPPSVLGDLPGVSELPDLGDVAAVLPLRLNADAVNDLVVLETDRSEPRVVATVAGSTFTVDSAGDESDFDSADNVCDTDDSADDGPCTLRAALEQANATASTTIIDFAIPQAGPWVIHTITPQTPLPPLIFGSITLDASNQAVQLVGSDVPDHTSGLVLSGPDNVVRSLRIQSFQGNGIEVASADNVVEGCQIGRVFGIQSAVGNARGIDVSGLGNTIGGALDAARNVISGNTEFGVALLQDGNDWNFVWNNSIGTDTSGRNPILSGTGERVQQRGIWVAEGHHVIVDNLIAANEVGIAVTGGSLIGGTSTGILGNFIGTDVDGTSALANGVGIELDPLVGDLEIGGPNTADRNLISGNDGSGIDIVGGSGDQPSLLVANNLIGTDVTGTEPLGNGSHGIWIAGLGGLTTIGLLDDPSLAGVNRIAFNGGNGISLASSSRAVFIGANEIFSNAGLGIDLDPAPGPTPNDLYDPDTGANDLQNYPVIESIDTVGGVSDVSLRLRSTPSSDFVLRLYASPTCDPSGYGEARAYLGSETVTSNAGGYATAVSHVPVPPGQYVTATATGMDASGPEIVYQTSELSVCRRENAACPYPPDLVIPAGPLPLFNFNACRTITTVGDVVVDSISTTEFRAGRRIIFGSGFKVLGSFRAVIDPSLDVP